MSTVQSFRACGILVDYSFYADREPYILNGAFALDNRSETPLRFSVRQVWCQAAGQVVPCEQYFVYRLPSFDQEDPEDISLLPGTSAQFEVSFPQLSAVPYLQSEVEVGIELRVAGTPVTVLSPYRITRRTPRLK
jgi:hypothetical protein